MLQQVTLTYAKAGPFLLIVYPMAGWFLIGLVMVILVAATVWNLDLEGFPSITVTVDLDVDGSTAELRSDD